MRGDPCSMKAVATSIRSFFRFLRTKRACMADLRLEDSDWRPGAYLLDVRSGPHHWKARLLRIK